MVGKSKAASLSEKNRMGLIRGLGCVACVLKNYPDAVCEVHHVVEGRVRLGHSQSMGLCLWHHRGEIDPDSGYSRQQMSVMIGPSLAHGSYDFADNFGSQATLVAVQDYIIDRFQADPWLELSMPRGVVLDIFYFWSDLQKADETA